MRFGKRVRLRSLWEGEFLVYHVHNFAVRSHNLVVPLLALLLWPVVNIKDIGLFPWRILDSCVVLSLDQRIQTILRTKILCTCELTDLKQLACFVPRYTTYRDTTISTNACPSNHHHFL